ncbi:MAG: hypothetical protein HFJ09_05195 [Lachnospiraceae bacterium]|nr:hypothetical protein [Lachnospiraceae bacterium]
MVKRGFSVICSLLCISLLGGTTINYASALFSNKEDVSENVAYDIEMWKDENNNVDYPITEDSKEWATFEEHNEMIAACNVPEELLKDMKTEELVNLMLDYPLLGDLKLYDDLNSGFNIMAQNSNILKELLRREDGASKLLDAYCNHELMKETNKIDKILEISKESSTACIDIINNKKYNSVVDEMQDSITENVFLETALAQKTIIEDLDCQEEDELAEEAIKKMEDKANSEIYAEVATTIYDVAKENDCADKLGDVVVETNQHEDNVKANSEYLTVKTPKGTRVIVYAYAYYGEANRIADTNYVKKNYPNATIKGPATNQYNCHSYAWYKQSTANKYWMNNPWAYYHDGSYSFTGTAKTGERIVYFDHSAAEKDVVPMAIHSGIIYSVSGNTVKVKSKWGCAPLVIHKKNYSPYGSICNYYK